MKQKIYYNPITEKFVRHRKFNWSDWIDAIAGGLALVGSILILLSLASMFQ